MDNPDLYSKAHNMQQHDTKKLLDMFWDQFNWSDQDNVLDFGCGDGDTTRRILADTIPKYKQLIGVDIVHQMVEFALKHHAPHNPRLSFRQLDILNDDVGNIFPEGFDKIFSFYVIHWIKDHKKLMENMLKITKPGGQILVLFGVNHPFFTIWDELSKHHQWSEYMKDADALIPPYHYDFSLTEEFPKACVEAGFEIVDCQIRNWSYTYESSKEILGAEEAVSPFLKRLPAELLEPYYNDKWNELKKLTTQLDDGAVTTNYHVTTALLRRPL